MNWIRFCFIWLGVCSAMVAIVAWSGADSELAKIFIRFGATGVSLGCFVSCFVKGKM